MENSMTSRKCSVCLVSDLGGRVLTVVTIPLCVSAPGPGEILRILSRETEAGGRGQAASASLGRVTLITSPGPGTSISPGASGLNRLH